MLALALPLVAACGAPQRYDSPLQHIVLIKLRDAGDTGALLADTRRHLSAVPGVEQLYVGRPFVLGRTGVDLDFDVAVIVGFADRAAYEAYLVHPEHTRLVNAWQPRFEWIRVHDALEGPEPAAEVEAEPAAAPDGATRPTD